MKKGREKEKKGEKSRKRGEKRKKGEKMRKKGEKREKERGLSQIIINTNIVFITNTVGTVLFFFLLT